MDAECNGPRLESAAQRFPARGDQACHDPEMAASDALCHLEAHASRPPGALVGGRATSDAQAAMRHRADKTLSARSGCGCSDAQKEQGPRTARPAGPGAHRTEAAALTNRHHKAWIHPMGVLPLRAMSSA